MFSVALTFSEISGCTVVALRGELDLADIPAVTSQLITAASASGSVIIMDLTSLAFISCGGLGALVRVRAMIKARGGELCLVAPQRQVRLVLEVTGLIKALPVYPSVLQALQCARPALPLVAADLGAAVAP